MTITAHTGPTITTELSEDDFTNGELNDLSMVEKHKKMCQLCELMAIRRFRDTGVWGHEFADQMAANAVK